MKKNLQFQQAVKVTNTRSFLDGHRGKIVGAATRRGPGKPDELIIDLGVALTAGGETFSSIVLEEDNLEEWT